MPRLISSPMSGNLEIFAKGTRMQSGLAGSRILAGCSFPSAKGFISQDSSPYVPQTQSSREIDVNASALAHEHRGEGRASIYHPCLIVEGGTASFFRFGLFFASLNLLILTTPPSSATQYLLLRRWW